MTTEFTGKAQYNVGIEAEFNSRLLAAIADLGIKKRATQVIAEIAEEYFDLWYVTEIAKRQKIDEVKSLVRTKRHLGPEVDPSIIAAEQEGTRKAVEYENRMRAEDKLKKRKRA